jgi:hypothetical protein
VQTSLPRAGLAFGILTLAIASCRSDPAHPSQKECQTGCDRLAGWQIATDKGERFKLVHEADESVDQAEDRVKADGDVIKAEIAAGYPPINPKRLEGLTPAQRKNALETYDWEQNQLKIQRADALKKGDEALVAQKKIYTDRLTGFKDWEVKALAEQVGKCMPVCMARPTAYAMCLQKTQAPEDAQICAKQ